MPKMNWQAARTRSTLSRSWSDDRYVERLAYRIAGPIDKPHPVKSQPEAPPHQSMRQRHEAREHSQPVIIVQGAASPTNSTGMRIVHEFPSITAARQAGFLWVK